MKIAVTGEDYAHSCGDINTGKTSPGKVALVGKSDLIQYALIQVSLEPYLELHVLELLNFRGGGPSCSPRS